MLSGFGRKTEEKERIVWKIIEKMPSLVADQDTLRLLVVPQPDVVARLSEGSPRDVEPTIAGEELVGIRTGVEEIN